ncbi:MAG: sensor histidine kinase [Ktedonobacterales bacterium]
MSVPRSEREQLERMEPPPDRPRPDAHARAWLAPLTAHGRAALVCMRRLVTRTPAALDRASSDLGLPTLVGATSAPFASTRRRLVLTNVVVVALVLAVVGVVVVTFSRHAAQQQVNQQLASFAMLQRPHAMDTLSGHDSGDHGPNPAPIYSPNSPNYFTVVLDSQGKIVEDDEQVLQYDVPVSTAAQHVLQGQQPQAFTTAEQGGHTYVLYSEPISLQGHTAGALVVGASLDLLGQQQESLLRELALVYLIVLLLTVLSNLYLTERALNPARLAFVRQRQFASAASHELRTPLAVIRSEAELVAGLLGDSLALLRPRASEPQALQLQTPQLEAMTGQLEESLSETRAITAEVDFMTRMASDLLLLARDTADARGRRWEIADLRTIVEEAAARLRPIAEREDLRLEVSAEAPAAAPAGESSGARTRPLLVRGDRDLLRQLVYGLLDNAVRYTPPGGAIHVEVRADRHAHVLGDHRRHAYVTVSDTGVGIAAEHLRHIFEPFYRAISTRPPRDAQIGTGLGLALAQWIVRAHDGTISVQSAVGSGTTFTVALPLAHTVGDAHAPSGHAPEDPPRQG